MKINEVAKLTGITVRTLHYYDEIDLLKPSKISKGGYRLYDDMALSKLQQILFFRELDFPLGEIKHIMTCPSFDKSKALENHKELLIKKRERLDKLVDLVNETIKGGSKMSFKEFSNAEIENIKVKYADEVKERWGNTAAFAQSEDKMATYGKSDWQQLGDEGNQILKAFACHIGAAPGSAEVQQLVKQWQDFITDKFYLCTTQMLQCLGEMYMNDDRFKENIDQNGAGTAEFMAQAIAIHCGKSL